MFGKTPYLPNDQKAISEMLKKPLGPEYIQNRASFGGASVHYLEGNKAIELANGSLI